MTIADKVNSRADATVAGDPAVTPADCPDICETFAVGDNRIHAVHPPASRIDAIIRLCASATRTLDVVLYMIDDSPGGRAVRDAMADAARRGVCVRALFDGFGSSTVDDAFLAPVRDAGGQVGWFNARRSLRYLIRNHQKLYIADRKIALVPGFNATDDYFGRSGTRSWEDMGVIIDGPMAGVIAGYCDTLFAIALDQRVRFGTVRRLIRSRRRDAGPIALLLGGPTRRLSPWARTLKHDLERAARIDLVSAYFSPTRGINRRIGRVAARGGAVRLILAGRTDNMATIGASRFLYARLLRAGARIFEFQPCQLHMKLIVIDDIVYVGSGNLDARSLFINLEVMLRIEDAALATAMRGLIDWMEGAAIEQTPALHRARATMLNRLRWALAYFATNTLDYTISRKADFGISA